MPKTGGMRTNKAEPAALARGRPSQTSTLGLEAKVRPNTAVAAANSNRQFPEGPYCWVMVPLGLVAPAAFTLLLPVVAIVAPPAIVKFVALS